jgi:2-keto-4-pentenoate hydratase
LPTAIANIQAAAAALRESRLSRQPIAKISRSFGIADLEAAYSVAEINVQIRQASGARIVGKKVGLTSPVVQSQLGVDQPDFGVLFDDMEYLSGADLGELGSVSCRMI